MDFNKINSSKLRILISDRECRELGLRVTDGDYDTRAARDAVRAIVAKARDAVGFKSDGERLLIQLYPAKHGGAEMFITRLSGVSEKEREALSESPNLTTYQGRESAFRFPDFEVLARAARALRIDLTARLYSSDDGSYYLVIPDEIMDGYSSAEVLTEFGTRISSAFQRSEAEHMKLLFSEIPLSTLAKM